MINRHLFKDSHPSLHTVLGHYWPASETFEWCFAGGPIVAPYCMLTGQNLHLVVHVIVVVYIFTEGRIQRWEMMVV